MAKRSRMTGAKELSASLRQIVPGLTVPMNEASRKALQPTLRAAKANLKRNGNVVTGKLHKLLSIRKSPKAKRGTVEHQVGPSNADPAYREGHLVEFGTAPHKVGERMHPGARAFPFMRPAFEETKNEVVKRFGESIGPAVEKRAAKLAKKAPKP